MLGVNLCESENLGVGERTAQLLLHIVKILDFLGRESQTFFLVVFLKVVNALDWLRLVVDGEDGLVETVVHTLEHRVVVGILGFNGEIFLDALNAIKTHVLCYFHGVGTPWSNHLTARSDEISVEALARFKLCVAVKPTQFLNLAFVELMVNFRCYHALG